MWKFLKLFRFWNVQINKFKRELLVRMHKEGEFSDAAIRQVEREMDIDELKLDLKVPKEELG